MNADPKPGRPGRLALALLLLAAVAAAPPDALAGKRAPRRAASPPRSAARPPERPAAPEREPARITGIRCWTNEEYTRVVVDLTAEAPFETRVVAADPARKLPDRIVVDFRGAAVTAEIVRRPVEVRNGLLKVVRAGRFKADTARVVVDLERPAAYQAVEMGDPPRLVLDIESGGKGEEKDGVPPVIQSPRGAPGGAWAELSAPPVPPLPPPPGAPAGTTPGGVPLAVPREAPPAVTFEEPPVRVAPPPVAAEGEAQEGGAGAGTGRSAAPPGAAAEGEAPRVPSSPRPPASALDEVARKARAALAAAEGKEAAPSEGAGAAKAEGEGKGGGKGAGKEPAVEAALPLSLRVMLDPGHGGKDPGAVGPTGLREKDVALAIGKRVRERLSRIPGVDVRMTRDTDVFIPLEERTALANRAKADLFVSLHINASPDRRAEGFSTYVLSKASDRQSLELAARENGVPVERLTDVKFIIDELALSRRSLTSLRLAKVVNDSLVRNVSSRYGRVQDLGLRKAPFYVLVGARMTAILVESSFISNAREEERLREDAYLDTIAESVVDAVRLYGRKSHMAATPAGEGKGRI